MAASPRKVGEIGRPPAANFTTIAAGIIKNTKMIKYMSTISRNDLLYKN